MKILNFLWGFTTGGIGKCFLTYDKIGDVEPNLHIYSICVVRDTLNNDLRPLMEQGIHVVHIKNNADFSWMKEVGRVVKKLQPDFFFAHGHNSPVFLYLLSLRYGFKIPFICTAHGCNPNRSSRIIMMYHRAWIWVLKRKFVKKIICVEKFTPPILTKEEGIDANKIVTVYNGLEPDIDVKPMDLSNYNINGPIIITASRLVRIKGLNYLLDALKIVKDKGICFHYFMIGDGEEFERLNVQARNLGLLDYVTFIGYRDNIPEWLAACDVFALPSLEEFHSIGILEAMRAQKAIVATNVGGTPESLRNGIDALMVNSEDPEALADVLCKVLTSEEIRRRLSCNARERFCQLFTIERMKKGLAQELLTTLK